MKRIFTGFNLIGAFALLALAVACTSMQTQNKENLLIAAGFKVIAPKTAAQQQKLQALPADTLEVWYARLDLETILESIKDQEAQKRLHGRVQKAEASDVLEVDSPKLVSLENGEPTIRDNPHARQ